MNLDRDVRRPGPQTGVDPIIELRHVSVHYPVRSTLFRRSAQVIRAVDDVSLTVYKGRSVGLVGDTGSGKSTVAQLIVGMVEPTAGLVSVVGREPSRLKGREVLEHRRKVQIVLQDPYSSLDSRMRVGDIIAEPLTLGYPGRGRSPHVRERVRELMGLVGLPASGIDLYPHQFSGGQRQRVAIARALAPGPDVIVLDEPTSALDVSVRAQILNLLRSVQEALGVTYLVVSHDLLTVAYLSATVAVMHQGRIIEAGPTRTIYFEPAHPYTILLLASAPTASGRNLISSADVDDSAMSSLPTSGCRYAADCRLRRLLGNPARCVVDEPLLTEVGADHSAACHFSHDARKTLLSEAS